MLSPKHSQRRLKDLTQLLTAVEEATRDTSLLALNMALEGASADAAGKAQLADAVGELSIRATQFSQRIRGRLRAGEELDANSLSELHRVTRGVADLIAEVSSLANDVLDGIADPNIERRLPEVASDLLDQLHNRAHALDHLVRAVAYLAPGDRELGDTTRASDEPTGPEV